MREVPAKLYGFMRANAAGAGLDVAGAARGLRLETIDPDRRGERVDWDDLALFLNRLYAGHDDEAMIAAGESLVQVHEWLAIAARILLTPRMVYQIGWELTRPAFPHWAITIEGWVDPIRIEVRMPSSYRGCRPMMLGTVGEMRVMPTLMGCPPAIVEADVGTHHAVYAITLADAPALRDRALRGGRAALDDFSQQVLALLEGALRADEARVGVALPSEPELQQRHGFTPAEARVAAQLITGASVARIARTFGVSQHTVRAQLRSMFDKTGARSQPALVSHLLRRSGPPGDHDGSASAGQSSE